MGVVSGVEGVGWVGRNGLQEGLFSSPQVVPHLPQEIRIFAVCFRIFWLHTYCPLEVLLSSVIVMSHQVEELSIVGQEENVVGFLAQGRFVKKLHPVALLQVFVGVNLRRHW
uniref:Uncharacterized protein n=1 Tax=Opuntia streptacantha TaxID=393608 RepID=A0A7C9DJ00_OPUST